MYSQETKEYAIECMKKGYKYATFYGTCAVLWKNKPKYERVHTVHTVSFGSSDGGYTFGPCMWVDTDSKGEDYFGTPDPDASILLSTLDSDWQRIFIKSLFEIAADGLTETLVKHIVDELTLNNIFEVKAVYGRICDIKHSDDSGQNRTYMLYANVTTDSEENGIVYCPKYSDVNVSYLRMMCRDGDASFDITELVKYELSRRSSTDSTKYFTDNELAWILDHAINMGVNDIDDYDIKFERRHTAITIYIVPSSRPIVSCSFELKRESRLFQKLDYYTNYRIRKGNLIARLSGKIFYINKEENHETD